MEYIEAIHEIRSRLSTGGDRYAAAAALHLAIEAWSNFAGGDPAWDQVGLELLDLRGRLYLDEDVAVDAEPPSGDSVQVRTAVSALLQELAAHHDRLARYGHGDLTVRLDHDAGAEQCRQAAAVLT